MKSPGHWAAGGACQTCHSPLDAVKAQPFLCPLCHGQLSRPWVSLLLLWGRTAQTQLSTARVLPRFEDMPNLSLSPPFLFSCHGMSLALSPQAAELSVVRAPREQQLSGVWGLCGGSGWLPSSTGSLCHQSLTEVPHLQCALEGWRRPATTAGPAMTKSAARGSATAARSSSGRAASSARPADTARNAEVRAGAAPRGWAGQGLRESGEVLG